MLILDEFIEQHPSFKSKYEIAEKQMKARNPYEIAKVVVVPINDDVYLYSVSSSSGLVKYLINIEEKEYLIPHYMFFELQSSHENISYVRYKYIDTQYQTHIIHIDEYGDEYDCLKFALN